VRWNSLDGHRSPQDVAKQLCCDERVVEMALDQLVAADLLDNAGALSVIRRAALRKMASAAAVGALVSSIPAPLAVAGQSGPSNGQPGDMEAS
jgi:hypothetical protein